MRIGMIWAEAHGGAIGRGGDMPWHLPEDLSHFKRITSGAPVVMGRRTWESLPERVRPLPGRTNIVVTRDREFQAPGAEVTWSLEDALDVAREAAAAPSERAPGVSDPTVWVMGGGQLYGAAMPLATELVVTRISLDTDGADTFAPEIGPEWRLVEPGTPLESASGLGYRFERWERR
ncbi:MAG: dihydrofolate reductase [Leucobacter sp.]